MVFSTPVFLFYFLVLTLLVYYLVPRKLRNVVILISSLIFYYWGEQTYVVIMFLSTAIDFTHGLLVEHFKGKGQLKYAKMAVASRPIHLLMTMSCPAFICPVVSTSSFFIFPTPVTEIRGWRTTLVTSV